MPFHLDVKPGQELIIAEQVYRIAAHPVLADYAYIQEGRKAWVCQLIAEGGGLQALKVFKPTYRTPLLVNLADRLKSYAELSGLAVCRRTVLSPERHKGLLKQHPDLVYAVLMPWIEGPTWMNLMQEGQSFVPEQSLRLAQALVEVLCGLEQQGLAHCDLSGPNVLLPELIQGPGIALVDVEDFYGPALQRPPYPSAGSFGYGHKTAKQGLWYPEADRFAGAVLLGEMLGMCDGRIPSHAYQNAGEAAESYFDPAEMQQESERYALLMQVLRERWGAAVAGLFERAWQSDVLAECPTFGEWLVALPEQVPEMPTSVPDAVLVVEPKPEPSENPAVSALIAAARRMAGQGDRAGAVAVYQQAQALLPVESGLWEELGILATDLEVPAVTVVPVQIPEPYRNPQALALLFAEGQAAYRREEWSRARELLSEVARQQPAYQQDGMSVSALLADLQQKTPKPALLPLYKLNKQNLIWGFVFLVCCLGLSGLGGVVWWGIGNKAGSSARSFTPTVDATSEKVAVAPTVRAEVATSRPRSTATARPVDTETPVPTVSIENGKAYLNGKLLVDVDRDAPGCFAVDSFEYSPTGDYFIVNVSCFEGDNEAFIFESDGSDKRSITSGCDDYMNYSNYVWAANGRSLFYERVSSVEGSCSSTLPDGLVRYDVSTGEKVVLVKNVHLMPMWSSPDSRWVAFVSDKIPYLAATDGAGLWILDDKCSDLKWGQISNGSMDLICKQNNRTLTTVKANGRTVPGGISVSVFSSTGASLFLRPSCGKTYYVSTGRRIELNYGVWASKGLDLAEGNARHFSVKLSIDDRTISNGSQMIVPMFSIPCGDMLVDSYWIINTVSIDSLAAGKHKVVVTYQFDQDITDGYDNDHDGKSDLYKANDPIRQTYTLIVQ